jgi:hypothetical protein
MLLKMLIRSRAWRDGRLDWNKDKLNITKILSLLLAPKLIKIVIVIMDTGEGKIYFALFIVYVEQKVGISITLQHCK